MQNKEAKLVIIQIKNIDAELRERARRVAISEGYYSINDVIRMFLYDYANKYIFMRRYWLGGTNPGAQELMRRMDEPSRKDQSTQAQTSQAQTAQDRDFEELESSLD